MKKEGKIREKRGKNQMQIEAILGFYRIGLSSDKIAEALNITLEQVDEIIENQ